MKFARKNIRLPADRYKGKQQYFLTICCHERQPLLATNETASLVLDKLRSTSAHSGFNIHAYCIMPDHLHILAEGASDEADLIKFANLFKQVTAYEFRQRSGESLWQFKYYDHILRRDEAMENVAWYIWMNPVRKGLTAQPNDYPYSGSFTGLGPSDTQIEGEWTPPWKNVAPPFRAASSGTASSIPNPSRSKLPG